MPRRSLSQRAPANDSEETMHHRTTVIGTGAMGQALAIALLDAGHPVTVWNRTRERADPLVARGAVLAADVVDAVSASELVLVSVLDSAAVRDVLDSAGDAVRDRTIVNLVTGTPGEARSVADWAVEHGADHLDGAMMAVPSMIGSPGATILYGGAVDAYHRHEPTLRTVASDSPFLGVDAGLPALYDVGLLTMLYATMTGWLQAFAVVGAGGVTAEEFLPHARAWFDNVVVAEDTAEVATSVDRREYPDTVPSSVALNAAALRLLLQVHEESGVGSGLVAAISALADQRVAEGHGADGFTSLVEAIRTPARN
ncbi:MAG: NAD(P)-dependent oxidoreductase [Acidimicrobiia bacterium]|nr:NAD(P)-dependent oxidoreductase [Acidimicrobiia bacterium]